MSDAAQSWLDAVTEGPDIPGLAGTRADAAKTFAQTGLPHRRMEDWKYTDIKTRLHEALPAAEPIAGAHLRARPFAEDVSYEIDLGNGFWAGTRGTLAPGVEAISLDEALTANTDWVTAHLGKGKAPEGHPMVALNTALMRDGAAIHIGKGVNAGSILLTNEGQSGRQMVRNLIVVEEGAEATIIETHQGSDDAQQIQQVTEVFLAKGAKLTHIRLQDAGVKTVHLATDLADVAEGANYRGFVLTTGGELARQESFIEFSGENAEAHISGAYMLSGTQHADVTTRINHAQPGCVSREVFKGVIADEARGVFQGKIIVAEGAQKTDGHQLCKTLLLSDKAEIDAKPELEIYADDVKCSHGATTGQLDPNHLFYLRARGIDEATARGLLMQSFLAEALEEVECDEVRQVLQSHVDAWLLAHANAWRAVA
jgi:Fe-S cluster assembly protein SufD